MGWGSMLVSLAALIGVSAYVARPLFSSSPDADWVIEAWIAQVRSEQRGSAHAAPRDLPVAAGAGAADDVINFCPTCGRRVEPDHVYCPACGRRLTKGEAL